MSFLARSTLLTKMINWLNAKVSNKWVNFSNFLFWIKEEVLLGCRQKIEPIRGESVFPHRWKYRFRFVRISCSLRISLNFTFFEVLWHSSTKHHYLLMVWSFNENFLNIRSHFRVSQDFVALVNDKIFALE